MTGVRLRGFVLLTLMEMVKSCMTEVPVAVNFPIVEVNQVLRVDTMETIAAMITIATVASIPKMILYLFSEQSTLMEILSHRFKIVE